MHMEQKNSLPQRLLGKTGLMVSVLGFGCGGFWGYEAFDEKSAGRLVHLALEQGVNFFDTGSSYSGGNAEIRLGRILKTVNRENLVISTKAGTVIRNGRLLKDYSPASITAQAHDSLRKLGLERLPLLLLHGIPRSGLDAALDTLEKLKAEGKAGWIGVSCDGADLETALATKRLDVVMLTYNLIEKQSIRQIEKAASLGCGVLIKSPLAHTLYSMDLFKVRKLSDLWYLLRVLKNYRGQLLAGRKYRFISEVDGWTSHGIAMRYALADQAACVVMGTTSEGHMLHNLAAIRNPLPVEIRDRIDAVR